MRTLRFIVDDQIIRKDPNCDFDNLVPGSEEYLEADFSFSREWDNCVKVVAFFSSLGVEYEPKVLKDGRTCIIPAEALQKKVFKVQVIGRRDNYRIKTNKEDVVQNGGTT